LLLSMQLTKVLGLNEPCRDSVRGKVQHTTSIFWTITHVHYDDVAWVHLSFRLLELRN